ncbi:MAG TPA: Dabb family protein [Acidimicrobiales bacterium]|nr:Dabb family protein [Acidimicrobiales bacterium]
MIRHIAVFRWAEGTTAEQIDAVAAGLRALPDQVPGIRSYEVGPDLRLGEGRWDFALAATFDDPAGYQAYVDHPAHQAVAQDLIGPIKADRAHVQLEI